MDRRIVATAGGVAITLAMGMGAAPAALASAAPVSSIYSAAQNACLDVSTTDPAHYFLDTYGAACNGSTVQGFAFRSVSGAAANTYHIVSKATGRCMVKYRQGIRQGACSSDAGWAFQRIGTTGSSYNILLPSTVGSAYPGCIQVNPKPNGYPGAIFTEVLCNSAPSQVLTLTNTL